jgi:hypothetical protein
MMCSRKLFSSLVAIIMTAPCYAQQVTNGLGDATVIQSATQSDPYGIAEVNSAIAGEVMSTRHRRPFGNSGIGGSYMGTTSVTSETRPVGEATVVQPTHIPVLVRAGAQKSIGKGLFSQNMLASPAVLPTSHLPAFFSMSAGDVLKLQSRSADEQLDMSSLMNKMSQHYDLMLNEYGRLGSNQKYYEPFRF